MKKTILCFDLDNTICITNKNDYKNAIPIKKSIKFINFLKGKGFYIKIFTSRYMGRSKENKILAKKRGYNFTKSLLDKWSLKYNELIFGKPSYDIFVDDKMLYFKKTWIKDLKRKLKKEKTI